MRILLKCALKNAPGVSGEGQRRALWMAASWRIARPCPMANGALAGVLFRVVVRWPGRPVDRYRTKCSGVTSRDGNCSHFGIKVQHKRSKGS